MRTVSKLDFLKIDESQLTDIELKFIEYEKRGVSIKFIHIFPTDMYLIQCHRKPTDYELEYCEFDEGWERIVVNHDTYYETTEETELKALELCEKTCNEFNF